LRLRKIVVERVTVVKFRVDNRGSNGTGCFRIKVRTDGYIQPNILDVRPATAFIASQSVS